ncbi:MAG: hypothetical protein IKA26_03130 [Alistipes sp.]|nr:hypothetical protein [Alistipes sp.]
MKINFSNFVKLFLAGASLLAVGCTDYGQDIQNLNDRIDDLQTDVIDPLAVDLEAVKADLAAAKTDLQAKIDANKALIDGLTKDLADAKSNIKKNADAIAAAQGDIDNLEKAVETINGQIDNLDKAVEKLKDQDEVFAKDIADLKTAVANNAAEIAANKQDIANLTKKVDDHLAAYALFVEKVDAKFIALDKEIEALKAKDAQIDEAIKALQDKDLELEGKINALQDAYTLLEGRVSTIEQEFADHLAAFAAVVDRVSKLEAGHDAQQILIEANQQAIKNLQDELAKTNGRVATLEAGLEEQKKALADAKKELQDNIDALDVKLSDYITKNDAAVKANADAIKKLNDDLTALETKLTDLINSVQDALQKQIDAIKGDLSALKGRIQSIVYVPEYTDGMATIEYAVFGNKIIECNSVMTYQVHPAECAGAVTKEDLSFLFQGLQTRAAVADAVQLEVVGVKVANATKGYIDVTVQAHNLGDNFYAGQAIGNDYSHYAVSLVFNHKVGEVENNIASCYTTLIAEKAENAAVISMGILNNEGKEIFDPQAQPVESHEIIYSDLETKKEFMPGSYPVFKLGSGKWFTYEQIVSAGYQISEPVQTITYNYYDKAGVETDAFKSVYNNVEAGEGYKYVTTNLAKVEKLAVKSYETVTYTYETDGNNASTTGKLTITKDKGTFDLGEATVAWARNLDNNVTVFSRDNIGYVLAEKVLPGKNTSYAEAVAGTLTTLTVNGADILANAWDLTDDKMSAELVKVAADAEPVLKFEGFEWNKTYTFVAIYELDNIDVTINFAVKTVLPKYTINLEEMVITWNYAQDWKSTFGLENTNRELAVVVKDSKAEYTENAVPAYADVIKNGVQNSLTAPDPIYELLENVIKCSKFDWNKSYAFAAEYALADALVAINGSVKTVQTLKDIVVTLPESTQDILPNLVINDTDHAINDVLATSFTEENVADLCLGTTTVQDYLTAIFADASLPAATIEANKRTTDYNATVEADATATTVLAVNADGQSANTFFAYTDGYSPIPAAVVYNLKVKTWYGINITFVKKLNFVLDTYNQYDYLAVPDFVFNLESLYFSNAIPYYTYSPSGSEFVNAIEVKLDMNTAFNVVDGNNNLVQMVDGKNTALGLVSTFEITGKYPSAHTGITLANNNLKYHGVDDAVGVKAVLTLVNTDGTLVATIPTQFDKQNKEGVAGIYSDYEVKKYDPIQKSVLNPGVQFDVVVDEAKTYIGYVMNGFQLKDKRGEGYNLVEHGALMTSADPNYSSNIVEWYAPKWLVGNGVDNGYTNNADVSDAANLYGLEVVYMDYATENDRAQVEYLVNAGALEFEDGAKSTGKIVFKNGNQIQLTRSVTFNVRVQVKYTWGTRDFTVPVTLNRISK